MKEKDRKYLQQCFLSMLTGGSHSYSESELRDWAEALNLPVDNTAMFCVVIRPTVPKAETVIQIKQQCEKTFADRNISSHVLVGNHMDVILVLREDPVFTPEALEKLSATLSKRIGTTVRLGVGMPYRQWHQLHHSVEEAYEAISWAGDYFTVAHIRDIGKNSGIDSAAVLGSRKAALDYFRRGMMDELEAELTQLAELVRAGTVVYQDAPYPTSIRRTMIEFLVEMLHIASDTGVDVDEQIGYADPYRKVFELKSTPEIIQWIIQIAEKLHQATRSRQARLETALLEKIKDYIQSNLEDMNLSLTMASQQLNMSPNYFSAFFIREAGIGFKEYVTAQRTELAKKYLLETGKSINEISALCGFLSPSYFISVFRNQTGVTPGQYRKQKN